MTQQQRDGPKRAVESEQKPPLAHRAKALPSSEESLRTQVHPAKRSPTTPPNHPSGKPRKLPAPHLPNPIPIRPKITQRPRDGPKRAVESEQTHPSRAARKLLLLPKNLCERRSAPRSAHPRPRHIIPGTTTEFQTAKHCQTSYLALHNSNHEPAVDSQPHRVPPVIYRTPNHATAHSPTHS